MYIHKILESVMDEFYQYTFISIFLVAGICK